tara:strand:+ start:179 stop:514 length:336 start_codon:yes stop_codon:yes gene_type:complete
MRSAAEGGGGAGDGTGVGGASGGGASAALGAAGSMILGGGGGTSNAANRPGVRRPYACGIQPLSLDKIVAGTGASAEETSYTIELFEPNTETTFATMPELLLKRQSVSKVT